MTLEVSTPTAVVTVDGTPVPVTRVSIQSDSSVDLSIPPRSLGAVGGADADFEWEQAPDVTDTAEHPWAPTWRATPGADVAIAVGTREEGTVPAFRGVLDSTPASLRNPVLTSSCVDPLSNVDATFSTPALTQMMPTRAGTGTGRRLAVNFSTLWLVTEAMEAIGARSGVPRTNRTVWRQTMAGSAWPSVGRLTSWSKMNTGGPYDPPQMTNFSTISHGRMACSEPYGSGDTEVWAGSVNSAWTIYHELDETTDGGYIVRVYGTANHQGYGIRVTNTQLQLIQTSTSFPPVETVIDTLPRAGATRVAARYSVGSTALSWATDADVGDTHDVTLASLHAAQGRVAVWSDDPGAQKVGQFDVVRTRPSIVNDTWIGARRTFGINLGTRWAERVSLTHPPIIEAPAVAWLTSFSQADQAVMVTDHHGVTWWSDPSTWATLPVTRTITDDGTGIDLDDLQRLVQRRPAYRAIRVRGMTAEVVTSANPYNSPNILANRVDRDIRMGANDDPQVFFLKPIEGDYWIGEIDTSLRRAGEPATQPWHDSGDFVHGRGSWYGGHVVSASGTPLRWARADDVYTSAWRLGPDTIKVIVTPGPGLISGQQYVNVPWPESPGLATSPVRLRTLPRLTTYGRARTDECEAVVPIFGSDPADPIYTHEAGWACPTEYDCRQFAEEMVQRYFQPGVITATVALCDVRVLQRVRLESTAHGGVIVDGVVVGIPDLTVSPGAATMRLRLWAMSVSVRPPAGSDYAPAYADLAYPALSYSGL